MATGVAPSLLGFDFRAIEEMDPSIAPVFVCLCSLFGEIKSLTMNIAHNIARDGFRIVYDRDVPFELRLREGSGALEAIKVKARPFCRTYAPTSASSCRYATHFLTRFQYVACLLPFFSSFLKVLVCGDDAAPHSARIELASENDVFFHFMHVIDEVGFQMMQEQQKLMVDFPEYPNVLIKMLNAAIKEPHSHLAVFVMERDGSARLDFIQNMEYKFVELLSCNFARSPDEVVRQQITYRYNSVKARLALMQARLQDVNANIVSRSRA